MPAPTSYRITLKCKECFYQGVYTYTKGQSTEVQTQTCTNCGLTGTTKDPDPLFEKIDMSEQSGG